jgi:beta-N-acetylhexosaminidase
MSKLTEAQRVGQLFLVGMSGDSAGSATAAAERQYHFGSMLFAANTSAGAQQVATTTKFVQSLATQADTGGVRFFVAANQEGGQVQNLKGAGFPDMPAATAQGQLSPSQLQGEAAEWGKDLKAAGVNLDLAPVMDVVPPGTASSNAPIGQLDREFGSTAAGNGAHGAAFIKGMTSAGVATSGKHFPGLGKVAGNTDFTANVVDTSTAPNDPDLATYRYAAQAGVPFMMIATATYKEIDPSHMAAFSPAVMKLLKTAAGFNGVVISDDLGDAANVASIPAGQRAIAFLQAGGDMVTSQSFAPAEQMEAAVLSRAQSDPSFRSTVNTAAGKILTAKQKYGLLSC